MTEEQLKEIEARAAAAWDTITDATLSALEQELGLVLRQPTHFRLLPNPPEGE